MDVAFVLFQRSREADDIPGVLWAARRGRSFQMRGVAVM
jgi:hypothetical protein